MNCIAVTALLGICGIFSAIGAVDSTTGSLGTTDPLHNEEVMTGIHSSTETTQLPSVNPAAEVENSNKNNKTDNGTTSEVTGIRSNTGPDISKATGASLPDNGSTSSITTSTTPAPTTSTSPPTTPSTEVPTPTTAKSTTTVTSTTPSTISTSTVPATTTTPTESTTTSSTNSTIVPMTTESPPTSKPANDRRFDGPSFIGGIVFALGVTAIAFVAWKFYKARTERNYHTL